MVAKMLLSYYVLPFDHCISPAAEMMLRLFEQVHRPSIKSSEMGITFNLKQFQGSFELLLWLQCITFYKVITSTIFKKSFDLPNHHYNQK